MQSCQGLIQFLQEKIESLPSSNNNGEHIANASKALSIYDNYIQETIVTPGLLQFNSGDKQKAKAMQTQVDAYKNSLVDNLQKRYPEKRLYTDHVISVNECTKKSVPSGNALETLKQGLQSLLYLAKNPS